jgi:predicted CDP-diglyceride synthetase/phosphatidate cytidylyltransferase
MGTIILIYVAFIIFLIAAQWIVYTKAGKPGWAILIPIYNLIVYLEIIGKPWWHLFLLLIPIYGWFILPIIWIHKLSKSFGHGVGFTFGLIFLGFIFLPILAFGSSKYVGPGGVPTQAQ